jgi:hypothetical protein
VDDTGSLISFPHLAGLASAAGARVEALLNEQMTEEESRAD